ncbi:MAG: insulinase family protein [Comamonas sp.]|nr:insulinase family protein [Comamonas sp.]
MKALLSLLCSACCLTALAENTTPASSTQPPLATASTEATAPSVSAAPVETNAPQAQTYTLSNGLELIVLPERRAPTAIHMLWLRTGSMDEVDGQSGVAHVLEHMLFKGSEALPPGEFSRRVAALGGQENAFTSRDYTGYYQQVPAQRLPDVMRMEAERFAHNQWPDEEFAKELEVVKEERRMRTEGRPRALLMEHLQASLFAAHPYRRPIVGWMSDLDSLTPEDARAFYRQWYAPNNAAVIVAGDVQPQQVLQWAQQTYGQIPRQALPERKPRTEPAQLGIKRLQVAQPAKQAYLAMAWKVPALRLADMQQPSEEDQDALALLVLSALLDGYSGARLERSLVQTRLADSASSGADVMGRGPGVFYLMGTPAEGKNSQQLEDGLRAQIQRIAKEGVQHAELRRVKTQWMASQVYGRDSLMGQAQSLGRYWVLGWPVNAEDWLLYHLHNISAEQVQSVAQRYFGDEQLTVATLLPQAPKNTTAATPATEANQGENAQ